MSNDDDHIGPFNGRVNRGPDIAARGCLWVAAIFAGFIAVFGGYRFYADWKKEACPPEWKCTPRAEWNDPNCKCWEGK